jgi:hypothetical protein
VDEGRFVEIFLTVEDGRVIDTGFLTNIPGDGLVCASLCCDAALGRTTQDAAALDEESFLARLPDNCRCRVSESGLPDFCLQAMRRAIRSAD